MDHHSHIPLPLSWQWQAALSLKVHTLKLLLTSEYLPSLSFLHATETIFFKKEAMLGRNNAHPYMAIYKKEYLPKE